MKISLDIPEEVKEARVEVFWIMQDEVQAARFYNHTPHELTATLEYQDFDPISITLKPEARQYLNVPVGWNL